MDPRWLALLIVIVPVSAFGGWLYLRQDALVFRPGPLLARSPADIGLTFEDLRLHADGQVVAGWWLGGSRDKAVLFFYGSDGNMTHELSTLRYLHLLGASVLVVDYPGYGRNPGKPSEQGCYRAAEAAWAAVCDRDFDPSDVIVFGQSLGSAVAAYLAGSRPCGGLVVHSGFTSVPDMAARAYPFLPVRYFCRAKMNSLERIAACRCPVLVLHSADDEHVPLSHARALFEQAPGPKRIVEFHGPHIGSHWQHVAAVRAAWLELLSERLERWQQGE